MRQKVYLALDLGAGSGRAIIGFLENGEIKLSEISRFENQMVQLNKTLYWDFLALFNSIKKSISTATQQGFEIHGIGVDTWGVDFALIDEDGDLISNPVCYRDERTNGLTEEVFKIIKKKELYEKTGIQIMEINTLFQLYSLQKEKTAMLNQASSLLFMPDLINYFLTGKKAAEYTIVSTSQFLNAKSKSWDLSILEKLNIPTHVLEKVIFPGETIGALRKEIVAETGATQAKVFAVGSHDTASAIGAIPVIDTKQAFLSSGTWSLMGMLSDQAIINEATLTNDFTNEGGIDDKILFMRNITGLWLLQRLISEWEEEGKKQSYDELLSLAKDVKPFQFIVNSDSPDFNNPIRMSEAIQNYCKHTRQAIPQTKGEFVRCVMESLAMKYYFVAKKMEDTSNREINLLSIVGGGSKNQILNQMIADALDVEVEVGLGEATALGNIIQQMIADKSVENWQEGHKIIENSFIFTRFSPQNHKIWIKAIHEKQHLFL